jgi:hypothetical protein
MNRGDLGCDGGGIRPAAVALGALAQSAAKYPHSKSEEETPATREVGYA